MRGASAIGLGRGLGFVLGLGLLLLSSACCRVGAGHVSVAELEEERVAQARAAGVGYEAIAVHPFVVVANARDVRDEAKTTVEWARDRLRADFFDRGEPGKPLTIWVFADEGSYMSGTSALLGVIPDTPYGFYRPCQRALVVNSGYGWGTLVHEMVHAYMAADFPGAPTWINEGLASLFEAPEDKDGHIRGLVNWRLPGLQRALLQEGGRPISFEQMAAGGRSDFDGKQGSLYYATSRYVLYWLQEHGMVRDFYRAFRSRGDDGQHGLAILKEVTKKDTRELRAEWERDVAALRYVPPRAR